MASAGVKLLPTSQGCCWYQASALASGQRCDCARKGTNEAENISSTSNGFDRRTDFLQVLKATEYWPSNPRLSNLPTSPALVRCITVAWPVFAAESGWWLGHEHR